MRGRLPRVNADTGTDRIIRFLDDDTNRARTRALQTNTGPVGPSIVRDLKGVMDRGRAEAAEAGFHDPPSLMPAVPKLMLPLFASDGTSKRAER